MKFERITLENFRQYFGRQRLEFARDGKRKVTIIHGVNGAGKTSLFLAINWCLYGSEYINNVGELLSKEAVSRANTSDSIEMSVEISFLHEGARYIVKRLRRGVKMIDGSAYSEEDEFTMGSVHGDGQYERIKNPIVTINAILPANVRTYFLFDGEKIDDFAKPESAKQVKEAIYLVFKLETLDRGRKHLEAIAADYRKELKKISTGELSTILLKEEKARSDLSQNERREIEVTEAKDSVLRKINDIDQRLREIQHVKLLQQQRDLVERELKQRRLDLDDVTNQVRDASTTAYFHLTLSIVKESLIILDNKRERGEIPSNIRKQFLQDILAEMKCICGRSFIEGSEEYYRISSLVKNKLPDSLGDDVLEVSAILRDFEKQKDIRMAKIKEIMQRRVYVLNQIKDLDQESSDLSYQLKNSPAEEVRNLEKQRQDFLADRDSYSSELGALGERIKKLNEDIAFLEKERDKAKKIEMKEKLLNEKADLAQKSADEIKDRYQLYANDMRLKIEAKTRDIFQKLIWKNSTFVVRLDEEFNLEVFDQYNKQARPELSAGERQVLSLSFITAMSRVSEEEAPLVMDTPFGRLSAKPRSNITANLPALADQLVLLVTDEELHGDARINLNPYIGAEYHLVFDTATHCTTIMDK